MDRDSRRASGLLIGLLGATVVCLGATIVSGYLTRLSLLGSGAWVAHTDEVTIAIDACRLHLLEADGSSPDPAAIEALTRAEEQVRALTDDNPRQQERVARAEAMTRELPGARAEVHQALRALFGELTAEEGALLAGRERELSDAKDRSAGAFAAGAVLTVLFATLAILSLQRERRVLAGALAELHHDRAMLRSIVESVSDAVIAANAEGQFLVMNEAAGQILGAAYPRDRLPPDWRPILTATYEDGKAMRPEDGPLARAVRGERVDHLVYEVKPRSEDARATWVSACARPVLDEQGRVAAGVVTMHDITQQRLHAAQLTALSLTDELTHLHNRRSFLLLAEQHLRSAARGKKPFALLFTDVNGLKRINDELGHEFGDRAICDAAQILRDVFRDSDVVARLGGDEFVVLLPEVTPATSGPLLERLEATLRSERVRAGLTYRVSLSTGVSFYDPEQPRTLQELLVEADQLMYAVKREKHAASASVVRAAAAAGKTGAPG
jgi:diguanylate cyclase (GGDEF)-like protein/PAS domain S-box-containing protein